MKILFKNALIPSVAARQYVAVGDKRITYVGAARPQGDFDREIDCTRRLLMPGFYNCHSHAAMTLFRGYGEDMPLDEWLNNRIFPAEDLLTDEAVYAASMLSAAEMIRGGTVSFSDMYFFCGNTARAAAESGMKANISRCIVSFDPDADFSSDVRFNEAKALFDEWNGEAEGRIKIDMSIHAEYTNVPRALRETADICAAKGARLHIHLSETEKEHREGITRRGVTPARFFADNGCFDVPVSAAHCVHVSDDDIALMAEKGVTAVHDPCSNLKLGSGVMPLTRMLAAGVNVALGTDGAASNNAPDMQREMYLASLLAKGLPAEGETNGDPTRGDAATVIRLATECGALSQGRKDCGRIAAGCAADIILIDLDAPNNIPLYDAAYTAVYSARSSDVTMTMVDGRILYENGEFTTIDIEKVREDMRRVCENYFKKH